MKHRHLPERNTRVNTLEAVTPLTGCRTLGKSFVSHPMGYRRDGGSPTDLKGLL